MGKVRESMDIWQEENLDPLSREDSEELEKYLADQESCLQFALDSEYSIIKDLPIIYDKKEIKNQFYKYMNLSQFMSLVQKGLFLNQIQKWDDTYEAAELRFPFDLPEKFKIEDEDRIIPFKSFYPKNNPLKYYYASSFSGSFDSDAMWRIYTTKNDGVMLEVDLTCLLEEKGGAIWKVIYYENMRDYLEKTKEGFFKYSDMLMLKKCFAKRNSFIHEDETRIVLMRMEMEPFLFITIPIEKFIKKVFINPLSDQYFVDILKNFLCDYNISVVKSELYKFPNDYLSVKYEKLT